MQMPRNIHFEQSYLNSDRLPLVWGVTEGGDATIDEVCAWLAAQKPTVDRIIDGDGALLLRGFTNVASAEDFERVLGVLAPRLMDYVGGTSPRKSVRGSIMTATELSGDHSLPLHQEMSYTAKHPSRIAFFCQVPSAPGGCTTLGDMRSITRRLHPEVKDRFRQKQGIQLRRTLPSPEAIGEKPGVVKPWPEVFNTHERAAVDDMASDRGWTTRWLKNNSVQLSQEIRPATKVHAKTGDEVWFNQTHFYAPVAAMKWASQDGRHDDCRRIDWARSHNPEMLDQMLHGDGAPIAEADALHIFDVFAEAAIPVLWQRSDVMLMDNTLIAHGRTPFTGDRRILAALVLQDAAAS
jgi:hypothetical protein